jgi:drug/metabolite transporter (DMT)-like permease
MGIVTELSRRMLAPLGTFLVLTVAGSVSLGFTCFPASSHLPASLACNISLVSPAIAAVVAGLLFGRKVTPLLSPFAALAPVIGLGILFLMGHLHYWFGQDIAAALSLTASYCLLPSVVASFVSAVVFSRQGANAL